MARPFLVSTDCAGVFGSVLVWKEIWGNVFKYPSFNGVEIIGWRWSEKLIKDAAKAHINVVGIHGRTGGWREDKELKGRLSMAAINEFFLTNNALVNIAPEVSYILLHRSSISTNSTKVLVKNYSKIKLLLIENVISENETEKTIETIQDLTHRGLTVGMTFDLVHFLREPGAKEKGAARFESLLKTLESFSTLSVPLNIHFPIGTYESDSLPVYKYTKSMWTGLSQAIFKANPKYIVLENQQERAYSFYLPESKRAEVKARNEDIVSMLFEWKIL